MAANWPTHRARRPIRKARHRWEARKRKRERLGLVAQKTSTKAPDREPIAERAGETAYSDR